VAKRESEPAEQPEAGALSELLALERQLADEIAAAESEAESITETARQEAAALEQGIAESFASDIRVLRETIDREADEQIRTIEGRADGECARFGSVDEATLSRLANAVAAEVAGESDDT